MTEAGSRVERDPLRLADNLIAAFEKLRTRSDGIAVQVHQTREMRSTGLWPMCFTGPAPDAWSWSA